MSGHTGRNDLPRDTRLERAWRTASTETPADSVDATILEAARAEASRSPVPGRRTNRSAWWSRWTPLVAAAGVGGLAFLLVQWLPREDSQPPGTAPSADAAGRAIAPPARPAPAPAPQPVAPPDRGKRMPAAKVMQEDAARETSAAVTSPEARSTAAAAAESSPDPETWARRIGELRASGDREAALTELRRFRQAYRDADAYLPEETRAWAAAIEAGTAVPSPER